jgi:hypothetical protein
LLDDCCFMIMIGKALATKMRLFLLKYLHPLLFLTNHSLKNKIRLETLCLMGRVYAHILLQMASGTAKLWVAKVGVTRRKLHTLQPLRSNLLPKMWSSNRECQETVQSS